MVSHNNYKDDLSFYFAYTTVTAGPFSTITIRWFGNISRIDDFVGETLSLAILEAKVSNLSGTILHSIILCSI